MPDSTTPLLALVLQTIGGNDNDWGRILNENIERVETSIAGVVSKTLTGNVTLTADEARASTIVLDGTPAGASNVIVPAVTKIYAVRNLCGGTQLITVKTAAGTGIIVPRGQTSILICDGTNVDYLRSGGDVPVGGMAMNAGAVTSGWDNYLSCLGQTVSRTTYAKLFAAIGTRFGVGDGSTTFGIPSSDDRYPRGGQAAEVGTLLSADIGPHNHTGTTSAIPNHTHGATSFVTDPGHSHIYNAGTSQFATAGGVGSSTAPFAQSTNAVLTGITVATGIDPSGGHSHTFTTDNSAGAETRPASFTVLYMIRFQ